MCLGITLHAPYEAASAGAFTKTYRRSIMREYEGVISCSVQNDLLRNRSEMIEARVMMRRRIEIRSSCR